MFEEQRDKALELTHEAYQLQDRLRKLARAALLDGDEGRKERAGRILEHAWDRYRRRDWYSIVLERPGHFPGALVELARKAVN